MSRRSRILVILAALVPVIGAVLWYIAGNTEGHNFSQFSGFREYFAENPPSHELPAADEQALLERYRPRFMLPKGHAGLIGFYEDYIAQGKLRDAEGIVLSASLDQLELNNVKDDPGVVFEHLPSVGVEQKPTVFARIDYDTLKVADAEEELTFLTYHAVFRHSGIVAGLSWWQSLGLMFAGDLNDWHQLDHYTAATLVLNAQGMPVALIVQQHNHQRTYVLGEGYVLPEDGRPVLDIAIRSNELYPHAPERRQHRTVRFPNRNSMRFLIGAEDAPWLSGYDITEPHEEAVYELSFLPHDDAFYTFKGYLGVQRLLPGRSGPPGADYNTLPQFKSLSTQLVVGYWREGDASDIARLDAALESDNWMEAFMRAQAQMLAVNIGCTAELQRVCGYQ